MTENEAKRYGEDYLKDLTCAVCEVADRHKDFVRMSIKALEKQIPKKPISISSVENSMYVKCPSCKLTTVLYDGCIMEYCKNCGQAIDWS